MAISQAQKKASQKWRETNREKYNEYQNKLAKDYYNNNKEKVLEYKKKKYIYDKQCEIFRNILI